MTNIPGRIAKLEVILGHLPIGGDRVHVSLPLSEIETLGLTEGASVVVMTDAGTNWFGLVGAKVQSFGATFERKGIESRYVYMTVRKAFAFAPKLEADRSRFNAARAVAEETADFEAVKKAFFG